MRGVDRLWRAALVALPTLLVFAGAPLPPAVAEPESGSAAAEFEDGSQAPAYGWVQEDGCPARTAQSNAPPIRGAIERAWQAKATDGTFEGEPLAWKDRVFVVERAGKRRTLRAIAAASGADRGRFGFDSASPLFPSLGEGRVVVKTSPTTLEALSVGDSMLSRRWKITAKEGIGAATMLRDEVYVVRDGVLERWAFGASAPTWPKGADDAVHVEGATGAEAGSTPTPRYARPSLRGGSVFVTSGSELIEVDRGNGTVRGKCSLGESVDPEASCVVVTSEAIFVRRKPPGAPAELDASRVTRSGGSIESAGTVALRAGLATLGPVWMGTVEDEKTRRLLGERSDGGSLVLAGGGLHDEFVGTPLTCVPGAVYAGLRAFAFPSFGVLRVSNPATASRAVPVRDRIVVEESPTVLSAWRGVRRGDEKIAFGAAGGSVTYKAARGALDDGRVIDGPLVYDPKAATFCSTKSGELPSCPARAVTAVLSTDAPRKLLFAARPADAPIGVAAIVRAESVKGILALVAKALAAGDPETARTALSTAVELGASDADVAKADASITAAEAQPPPKDDAKAAEVVSELSTYGKREIATLLEAVDGMAKDAPIEVTAALVRAVLQHEPENERAVAWVRARLPKRLPLKGEFKAGEWLDFVEVQGRLKIRLWGVDPETKEGWASDGAVPAQDSPLFTDYWSAHDAWPGGVEVVVFECGPLVVFAPLERPGSIAKCLALGRLVNDTLDKTFSPMGPPRSDSESMILQMFSKRSDYLEFSRPGGEADRADGLENTAGHYSPGENVTRIFFPDEDDDADSVPGVYAHELTHHWIERRRPGVGKDALGDRSSATPGYFCVEGFADFVRSFVFDVAGQRATLENPRADHADVLTGIAPESLIPWPKLLTMTQAEFHTLTITDRIPVPRRWRLGPVGSTAPILLFYDQGSATCAYLYLAENGKYRKALLDFVYAYYSGAAKADTLTKSTGLSLDEIGKRVVAWCKELSKKG